MILDIPMQTNPTPPIWRQHLMRVLFLLNIISLGPDNWSAILFPTEPIAALEGVAISFYAALSVCCILGVRFPLQFTPLLLLQLIYKSAWLVGVYLPATHISPMEEHLESWFWVMAPGVVIDLLVIPWPYAYREYLKYFFRLKKTQ